MSFCLDCDSLLEFNEVKGKTVSVCPDCDFSQENDLAYENLKIQEEIEHTPKDKIEIIEDDAEGRISNEIREELTEMYRESMSSIN